jgi:hypothetical protein
MPFLPPSCRFPPRREGNRTGVGSPCLARGTVHGARVRFPLLAGGTHRRGVRNFAYFRTPSPYPLTFRIKVWYNRNASDHQEWERADRGCTQPPALSPFENPLDTF